MTNPEQPAGPAHPARAAGYALLGVAAIALLIGMVSLFVSGSDDGPPAAQETTEQTSQSTTSSQTSEPSQTSAPSQTSPGESTTSESPTTSAPPSTGASDPGAPTTTGNAVATSGNDTPPPPVNTVPKPPVRVYNNSTTQGLAARASEDVERAGWQVAEKGNYSQGTIWTTTVYFRPGTDEEASARELARILNARVEARFDGIQGAQPGIIVIVTNDYKGPSAKAAS